MEHACTDWTLHPAARGCEDLTSCGAVVQADEEAAVPGHAAFKSLFAAHVVLGVSALALSVAVVCLLLKKKHTHPAH